ncbi:MAG: hypothetical protein ABJF88_17760 [Rhodothermales bacterium]
MSISKQLTATAAIWTKFARTRGARFQIERKADDALKFCVDAGTRSFAVPSKLEGTSQFQENIARALPHLDRFSRKLSAEITEDGRIALSFGIHPLGYVRRKHECWVRPLVENGYVLFYLHQVTGGTEGKPTRGVNVCIYNLREAIQQYAARMEAEAFLELIS